MRPLGINDAEQAKKELRRKAVDSSYRYIHRLHCIVFVAAGHSCCKVAAIFGDDPRSICRWVKAYRQFGVEALRECRVAGRHALLTGIQQLELTQVLADTPRAFGHAKNHWSGELLRTVVWQRFGVRFSSRHCRRLIQTR